MNHLPSSGATLVCPHCDWCEHCLANDLLKRLQELGLLRRASEPPTDMLHELIQAYANRLSCDHCQQVGLSIQLGAPTDQEGEEDWQQAIVCEVCHQPIGPERLEVFPRATRCVACQDLADRGLEPVEPDFCPKCGSLVELRVSSGSGITRYKQFCTSGCRLS